MLERVLSLAAIVGCATPVIPQPSAPSLARGPTPALVRGTDPGCLEGDCENGAGVAWRVVADREVLLEGRFSSGRLIEGTLGLCTPRGVFAMRVARGRAVLQRRGYAIEVPLCGDVPCRHAELRVGGQAFDIEWDGRIAGVRPRRGLASALATAIGDVDAGELLSEVRLAMLATDPPITIVLDSGTHEVELVALGTPAIAFSRAKELAYGWVPMTFVLEIAGTGPLHERQLHVRDGVIVGEPVRHPRRAWSEIVPSRLARIRDDLRGALDQHEGRDLALRDARIAAEQAHVAAANAPYRTRIELSALLFALDDLEVRYGVTLRLAELSVASRFARNLEIEITRVLAVVDEITDRSRS